LKNKGNWRHKVSFYQNNLKTGAAVIILLSIVLIILAYFSKITPKQINIIVGEYILIDTAVLAVGITMFTIIQLKGDLTVLKNRIFLNHFEALLIFASLGLFFSLSVVFLGSIDYFTLAMLPLMHIINQTGPEYLIVPFAISTILTFLSILMLTTISDWIIDALKRDSNPK
jgi:hypothetical protein